MLRHAEDFDAVRRVANVGVANGRAGNFVGFAQTQLQLVRAGRFATRNVVQVRAIRTDADIVSVILGGRAWQDDAQPRILGVRGVPIDIGELAAPHVDGPAKE